MKAKVKIQLPKNWIQETPTCFLNTVTGFTVKEIDPFQPLTNDIYYVILDCEGIDYIGSAFTIFENPFLIADTHIF